MPSGGPPGRRPVPRRRGDRGQAARAKPHHVVAALLGLAVLVTLALSGVVPALGAPGLAPGLASRARPLGAAPAPPTPSTPAPATSTTAPPGPLTMVGLGDSVPSAETCFCTGYVEQVAARLQEQTGRPWSVHNDAHGGWTTADVEHDLSSPNVRTDLADAALVVVEVGANDFDLDRVDDLACFPAFGSDCWAATNNGVRDGLQRIVTGIRSIDRRPDV